MRTCARPGPTALLRLLCALLALASPAVLAAAGAPPKRPSLEERIAAEVDSPRALADLYRLYERRDRSRDLSGVARTLDQVAASPKARPDVKALALELRAQVAISEGHLNTQ